MRFHCFLHLSFPRNLSAPLRGALLSTRAAGRVLGKSRTMSTSAASSLTDDQRSFQQLARTFAASEMIPAAAHHDQTGEFPSAVFDKAWELGLVNTHIPEEYGGMGLSVRGTLSNPDSTAVQMTPHLHPLEMQ